MKSWHALDVSDLENLLKTSLTSGLSEEDAARRLEEYGPNVLPSGRKRTLFDRLKDQLLDPLVLLLIAASLISAFIGEVIDATAIIVIVVINTIIGVYQEYKAEQALDALKKLSAPVVKVLRDGVVKRVPADALVPGDVILLEAGDKVPADARLVEVFELMVDESVLTGESQPVLKTTEPLPEDTPLPDRKNMVYMGTVVIRGRAKAVVVATGTATELGKIALSLTEIEEEKTPLQRKMAEFSAKLTVITLIIVVLVFAVGFWRAGSHGIKAIIDNFMVAVSLAVAAVPEGLPAVMTLVLAVGVLEMARENAIVKRLAAVETLGSTTEICTDKTGTLTKNEMTVRLVRTPLTGYVKVTGEGYEPVGEIVGPKTPELDWILKISALCNDAWLYRNEDGKWVIEGDPTEGALLVLAAKGGLDVESIRGQCPRVGEIPFDSVRKMMTTINKCEEGVYALSKGAVESILRVSSRIQVNGSIRNLTDDDIKEIMSSAEEMAGQALRVLAFAYKPIDSADAENIESEMIFVGLVGMMDPPRPEVPDAIKTCKTAGIRVAMVTGDHPVTAVAIAKEIGLIAEGESEVVTGRDLEHMDDERLRDIVERVKVFARVTPEHKLRIVNALKSLGHIVAMTGDGVNDAPALKRADIGVAMGMRGTEVAKEAADLILLDDNFATIVKAIRRGRIIYDNIRKFVQFLLSCNLGEVAIVFLSEVIGWGSPFRPIHLLFLNLLTDSFPAIALGVEGPERDVMKRPPRDPKEPLLDKRMSYMMLVTAALITVTILGVYWMVKYRMALASMASTATLATLIIAEVVRAYPVRSERDWVLFTPRMFSNMSLNLATVISIILLLVAMYMPGLNEVMKLQPIKSPVLWGVILVGSIIPALGVELAKVIYNKFYDGGGR